MYILRFSLSSPKCSQQEESSKKMKIITVLSPFLNEKTDGDCPSIKGSLFQYLDAVIVKVLSLASF